jgi:predicted HTH transcriptional regulator
MQFINHTEGETMINFQAPTAIPFILWRGEVTAADVADRFNLTFRDAQSALHRLKKKDIIHTVSRGGGATLSTYRYGPQPRQERPAWWPHRDMVVFLGSIGGAECQL